MSKANGTPVLFTVWGTPVKVKPVFWANVLGLWGLLSWLSGRAKPERPWAMRLLAGLLSALALLAADVGHAMAHILSARYAGAPMDEILLSEGMPRTVYHDNDVPPRVHRLRALGGPLYSAVGLLTSLALRALAPRGSLAREVTNWSCLGHSFILGGSLVPLPIVDGGAILKWTLVERGQAPEEADEVIRQINLSLGMAATATGAALAVTRRGSPPQRRWLPALGLIAAGGIALAAALGKIR
jgi:hypothetical protein